MELKDEPLEAGFEDIQVTLKKRVDLYIGQILETEDSEGNRVLGVVTEIDKIKLEKGKLSVDCKIQPLQLLQEGS